MPKNTWNILSPDSVSRATDPSRTQRATRACDPCRKRRVKCEGLKPTCRQCQLSGSTCSYSDVKRVREKKELESANTKIERYEALLLAIIGDVDEAVEDKIMNAINGPKESTDGMSLVRSASPSPNESADELDTVHEDINSSEVLRATGFMGKNSEVHWMRSLELGAARSQRGDPSASDEWTPAPKESSLSSMNYHLDHLRPSETDQVDAYGMPSRQIADKLFEAYLTSIDDSYPIIRRSFFILQYQRFFSGLSTKPGDKWLAILNMVFAIGAKRAESSLPRSPNTTDHWLYFSRAHALSMRTGSLYDHADLQQVQFEALTALYFLSIAQVNRAWKMIGMAARSGISLGINMRPTGEEIPWIREESRTRLWWSIYNLECLLSVMTGRASCLVSASYTRYPPLPFEDKQYRESITLELFRRPQLIESKLRWTLDRQPTEAESTTIWLRSLEPTPSLYFYYMVDLAMISRAIIDDIYHPKILHEKWAATKFQIRLHNATLDSWVARITDSFRFMDEDGTALSVDSRYQIGLALGYYSNRILINRPGLTLRRRIRDTVDTGSTPDTDDTDDSKSSKSRSRFDDIISFKCLRAALDVIALLPGEPNSAWIYEKSPWWSILHFLMQATVVLQLWLSAIPVPVATSPRDGMQIEDDTPMKESYEEVLSGCQKALLWLKYLSGQNESALRAYELCYRLFRRREAPQEPTQPELFSSTTFLGPQANHPAQPYLTQSDNVFGDTQVKGPLFSFEEQLQFQTRNPMLVQLFNPAAVPKPDIEMGESFVL